MITEEQLERANRLVERRDRIKHILRGFDSPHVETTVGLVDVNSAHEKIDRLLDAVMNKGYRCFATPETIKQLRRSEAAGLITFEITANDCVPDGQLVAVAPVPTVKEIGGWLGMPKQVLTDDNEFDAMTFPRIKTRF